MAEMNEPNAAGDATSSLSLEDLLVWRDRTYARYQEAGELENQVRRRLNEEVRRYARTDTGWQDVGLQRPEADKVHRAAAALLAAEAVTRDAMWEYGRAAADYALAKELAQNRTRE